MAGVALAQAKPSDAEAWGKERGGILQGSSKRKGVGQIQ
jgi:hypothetical protein